MEENMKTLTTVLEHYGADPEALVEILRDLSQEAGYLSQETLLAVANRLQLPPGHVHSVASFYSMMSVKPQGCHKVQMCQDAPCHVAGGREVWDALEETLGIPFGATTLDGEWTLQATSCLGLCAVGPVIMIDDEVYGNMTAAKVRELLGHRRGGCCGGDEGGAA